MPQLKNFVAIDWRSGPDRIYFFFKDSDTYSRFDLADNKVSTNYPAPVTDSWDSFGPYAKGLRFGLTTTSFGWNTPTDEDIAWLFFYQGTTPVVCKYNQDKDKVDAFYKVSDSIWKPILPYFDKIIAGTWFQLTGHPFLFRFILNDGHYLSFNYKAKTLTYKSFGDHQLGALQPYKDRIITAAQNDRTFADSYWYIFLTNNQYLTYNIQSDRLVSGPQTINDENWPGLLRG
ncbi:hypothetical protein ACIOVC_08985 [Pseudomonas neuropathica]|uniref:Hemopexin n=1 Tax=Pseudomonas zeae TaxID=2745510 RepID=A0ABU5BTJ7_9PSED|nr:MULTISPECIES: hypothetical protein [Pseudomonas]MDX9679746.1 hypothetical protein [Pseudomonas zeae]PIF48546.1 hypothetical protein CLU80_0805 [Pseudomonas sp. 29]SEO58941.1 hypothetical protein SAMN04487856_10934 [Pseudomonas sp. ok266]